MIVFIQTEKCTLRANVTIATINLAEILLQATAHIQTETPIAEISAWHAISNGKTKEMLY
jgi:hypothetical protein